MLESIQSLNRAAVPGRPRVLWERAVKREVYQVRVLPFVVSGFLVVWALLLFAPMRTPAQSPTPSPSESSPTQKQDDAKPQSPDAGTPDPKVDPKSQDQKPTDSQVVKDDVRKNTVGTKLKPQVGLKLDVDLALVNVTVTDPYNRLVTGLDPDNFRVYEDNVEQEVVTFSSEDVPISIGVIFDMSGSMTNKIGKAREAAIQFFKTANPQDEFFLVSFNERAEMTSAFTNSVED